MRKKITALYFFTLFILYVVSMQPWFMWHFSYAAVYFVGAIVSLYFYNTHKAQLSWSKGSQKLFVVLIIGMCWLSFRSPIMVGVGNMFFLVTFYVFLGTSKELKHDLLLYIKKYFAIILLFSLAFYFLHVIGIPLPSVYSDYGLYGTDNYFFFVLTHGDNEAFNRFRGIFGEPGFMTLGIIPLFFAGKFDLRDKYNLILLLAELVSFSLAGYAVLVIITGYYCFASSQFKKYARWFVVVLVLFISLFAIRNQEIFELIDTNILVRVAINENTGNIAGYNRSTEMMDEMFDKFKKTPAIIYGIGANEMNHIRKVTSIDDGGGNAGLKMYTYMYGYIGVIVFMLFYWLCFKHNTSRDNFVYLICLFMLLFQNSYVDWYCVAIGSYLCFNELRQPRYRRKRLTIITTNIQDENIILSNNSSL